MEHPITMMAEMVAEIKRGYKYMTRRLVRPAPPDREIRWKEHSKFPGLWVPYAPDGKMLNSIQGSKKNACEFRCPCGTGTVVMLWVREAFAYVSDFHGTDPGTAALAAGCFYRQDYGRTLENDDGSKVRWRPSIHMPRRLSRFTLDVLDVRIERIQDISDEDVLGEGIRSWTKDGKVKKYWIADAYHHVPESEMSVPWQDMPRSPRDAFKLLWSRIHGPASWDSNPWVWMIEFRKVE